MKTFLLIIFSLTVGCSDSDRADPDGESREHRERDADADDSGVVLLDASTPAPVSNLKKYDGGQRAVDSSVPAPDAGHRDTTDAAVIDAGPKRVDSGAIPMCTPANGDCTAGNDTCCNGSACVSDVRGGHGVCAAICLRHDQCASGCCDALASGTAAVCSPVEYCASACSAPGAECGVGVTCCDGSTCAIDVDDVPRCAADCSQHTQCVSGCCAPLNGGGAVCSDPAFCE